MSQEFSGYGAEPSISAADLKEEFEKNQLRDKREQERIAQAKKIRGARSAVTALRSDDGLLQE